MDRERKQYLIVINKLTTMKKLFIAILAVTGLVACSQDQLVEAPKSVAIAFDNAFVNNSTRAEDITKATLKDFGVYGSVEKEVDSEIQQGLIFTNQRVYKSGDAFIYSPAQYWIADAQYDFVAIAPYTNAKWAYTTTDAENGTLTLNNGNDGAQGEQDLLFAYTKPAKTEATLTQSPGKVGFTFSHILSKVLFIFNNKFTDGNISLKVYDVKINNTAANGTVAVANGVVGEWESTNTNNDYIRAFGPATADAVAKIENGKNMTTEYFYLIPVQRNYEIEFKVDIYQAGVKLDTYEHSITTPINLEKGKSYSLNADLTPQTVNPDAHLYPIEFKVDDITGWTPATQDIVSNN